MFSRACLFVVCARGARVRLWWVIVCLQVSVAVRKKKKAVESLLERSRMVGPLYPRFVSACKVRAPVSGSYRELQRGYRILRLRRASCD